MWKRTERTEIDLQKKKKKIWMPKPIPIGPKVAIKYSNTLQEIENICTTKYSITKKNRGFGKKGFALD